MNTELDPLGPLGPTDAQIARMHAGVRATISIDQVRTRRRRGWTIGGTLGLLVVLAGGTSVAMAAGVLRAPAWFTAASAPAPTATATATREPITVTVPTPTPSPTTTSAPVTFDLPCEQQIDPAVLARVAPGLTLGTSIIAPQSGDVAQRLTLAPVGIPSEAVADLAAAQSGYYSCTWGGPSTVSLPVAQISLAVLPAAAGSFDADSAYYAGNPPAQQLPPLPLGDREFAGCADDAFHNGCRIDILQDDLWLAVVVTPGSGHALDASSAATALSSVAESALSRLFTAGMEPPAAEPGTSPQLSSTDCSAIQRALTSQLGGAALTWSGLSADDDAPLLREAFNESGAYTCSAANLTEVTVIPGAGSWGWAVPYDPLDTVTALSVAGTPGVASAREVCPWHTSCWVDGVVDGAIVTVSATDTPTALREIAAIAHAVG
ncbi:hypothetical protein GCM10022286_15520 [Gryllotalpicola daejeonensis]|uniref:Uncharacterized protein n=1 Tax=Gryllotalpicola daejeonensis TaxID=993087 RepID=A0ABP7ZJF3_9MICO